jgi:hypothetical protein
MKTTSPLSFGRERSGTRAPSANSFLRRPVRPSCLGGVRPVPRGAYVRADLVALSTYSPPSGLGDHAAVGPAQFVVAAVPPARYDPAHEHVGDLAEGGVVVLSLLCNQAVVALGLGGVDFAGVLGGEQERTQAR